MALSHRHDEPPTSPTRSPLAFSRSDGPLVAVAGLCGGAGTSTIALLLASAAAAHSSAPVLLAGGGSHGSLVDLAHQVEAGRQAAEAPFEVVGDGLRLIAGAPQFEREADESALEMIFDDAKVAHGLTVVDCSSLNTAADLVALRRATHVVWSVTDTDLGAARAGAVLDSLELPLVGRELLAVRREGAGALVPATTWTTIARRRDCDVVLIPHVPELFELPVDERVARTGAALDALAGALR
jgi:MinD-like ATPase involved in chromosome partitioning or flagellar assembly